LEKSPHAEPLNANDCATLPSLYLKPVLEVKHIKTMRKKTTQLWKSHVVIHIAPWETRFLHFGAGCGSQQGMPCIGLKPFQS